MGGFDWIIAAILVVSILVGIFRGFIKESLSLISWILAIWLAFNFCTQAGEFIHQYINIPAPKFREWAGFASVFISTLFVFSIISYIITKIFVRGPIKGVDRVLGLGFGGLRGVAIVVAVLVVAKGFGMETSEWWQNSQQIRKFEPFVKTVEELFPDSGLTPEEDDGDFTQTASEQAIKALVEVNQ
ncbi:MAG: membrane protein required for colicin V production [Arenicella sp.]|jgi:membrane protein required for colicin V production